MNVGTRTNLTYKKDKLKMKVVVYNKGQKMDKIVICFKTLFHDRMNKLMCTAGDENAICWKICNHLDL